MWCEKVVEGRKGEEEEGRREEGLVRETLAIDLPV